VLNIVEKERPLGVVVQFGGQTPLKLAVPLREAGVPILGTSPDAIDRAEDRQRFHELITDLGLRQAAGATARSLEEAQGIASSIGEDQIETLREQTKALAKALGVIGLINVQFAIQSETVYVLEVNPRASRTVPFVSKAIGLPLAKVATRAMLGHPLGPYAAYDARELTHIAVKESVFPFVKFPGVDAVLGPEMKSTGEVMGIDRD